MIRKNQHRPLYREVMWDAFRTAWHTRSLWILGLFAGILQTGGIYDILFLSLNKIAGQIHMASSSWLGGFGTTFRTQNLWHDFLAMGIGRFLLGSFLVLIFVILSLIAQGALTAGIGFRIRGRAFTLRQLLKIGLNCILPIAALNIISLGLIWIARSFIFIPLLFAVRGPSVWNIFGTIIGLLIFVFIVILLVSIQMFGLQAIVIHNASFAEAMQKAIHLFKKSWVIILEKALLLLILGVGIMALALVIFALTGIPLFLLWFAAIPLQAPVLALIVYTLLTILFFLVMGCAGMFAIVFQYAAWNGIYRRVSEGAALAKFHRFTKWLMEEFHLFHHHRM